MKCLVTDPFQQLIVSGSNDGDVKVILNLFDDSMRFVLEVLHFFSWSIFPFFSRSSLLQNLIRAPHCDVEVTMT